jgi:aerobic carbon-monoxide dehydrogenase large subunit
MTEPKGRGAAWTEERGPRNEGTSDEACPSRRGAAPPGLRSEGARNERPSDEGRGRGEGGRGGGRGPGGEQESTAYGPVRRKEDARFIRGQGTFTDDIQLPGMLHGAVLRSPLAHARIASIDTSAAEAHPRVKAVITGQMLDDRGLAWMPTLSHDVQAVLATDKVRFQGQEVAFVVAEDRYSARDALELINVDYEPLPAVIDATIALDPGAPVIRDDLAGQQDNHIFDWEAGDQAATDAVFAGADVVVGQDMLYPRSHPAPLETCGAVADFNPVSGQLTVWTTSQAPHAHRTLYALVIGIPEHKIRIISPDIGGGFGNKAPIYPGYICAIVGSMVTGSPVKWMEDRSENLMSTTFARDYHMRGEIAATRDGRILGLRARVLADHGAFNGSAQPSKFPAGFFHIFTGSYDLRAAHCQVTGVYTNKAPGGVAYSCSFRITEAVYLVERMVDLLARELGMDSAELRMKNLLRPEQFPYTCPTGWQYDSGNYPRALQVAMDIADYPELRREQAEKRERGEYMGVGISFFTEGVGAGPRKHMDILGLGMADGAHLRVHPTGKAVLSVSCQSQGQGHETTFAQIVAQELGLSPDDVEVVHGDTDRTPFGLGTYGSRSTPVSGAAAAIVARKVRERARIVASVILEVSSDDLEWTDGQWRVRGDPENGLGIAEIAMAAHGPLELPEGVEGHLDAETVYNPPNLTHPFGAYICVTDVDPGTGQVQVRRFIAVDDCGVRINPMIVEGQVHGGLADGVGMALMQVIAFDEEGNCLGGSFMDYLIPTAVECPSWELGATVTPSPHHPIGAKGVGESATVGSPPAIVNSVLDALAPFGVRHADMPLTPANVWRAIQGRPLRTDLAAP